MKTRFLLTILAAIFAAEVLGETRTLPIDSQLPKVGDEWIRRGDDGANGDHSWVNFDNKKSTGDVLSFVTGKVPSVIKVTATIISQESIEAFLNNGSAARPGSKHGLPITDYVRHRIISINVTGPDFKRDIEALEYTYFYEGSNGSAATIAHGYCVVVGETAFFVQHTSPKAISSELAFEMVCGLLLKNFQFTGKPHSCQKGEVLKTNS